jgi:hypothetical protein
MADEFMDKLKKIAENTDIFNDQRYKDFIKEILISAPSFNNLPDINLNIGAPKIDVSLNIEEFNSNLPEISADLPDLDFNLPEFAEPYDKRGSGFDISKIYDYIKKKSQFLKGLL